MLITEYMYSSVFKPDVIKGMIYVAGHFCHFGKSQWYYPLILNPCPAELLQLYFSSFEAGIANAISSFKWRKILIFMKNRHV